MYVSVHRYSNNNNTATKDYTTNTTTTTTTELSDAMQTAKIDAMQRPLYTYLCPPLKQPLLMQNS